MSPASPCSPVCSLAAMLIQPPALLILPSPCETRRPYTFLEDPTLWIKMLKSGCRCEVVS
jgi:hypothetical protein